MIALEKDSQIPLTKVTEEATRTLPFLLGASLALYVHIKLCFLFVLDFQSTWIGNVFLSAVEVFEPRSSKQAKCCDGFVGPGPI